MSTSTAGDVIVQIHCLFDHRQLLQHMDGSNLSADFQVTDSSDVYKRVGRLVRVDDAQHVLQDFMVANYQQLDDKGSLQAIERPESRSRPTDVWLAF